MIKLISKSKGFTLIEIILTAFIISVGLFGVMAIYGNAVRDVTEGDISLTAAYLARERMEQLISDKVNYGYDNLVDGSYSEPVTLGSYAFTRSYDIGEVDKNDLVGSQPGSGFKRIDMSVSWGEDAWESIVLSTIVTDY